MTISSEVRKTSPFVGDDVETTFPFAFKVFTTADVLVVRADSLGVETVLTLTTHYTVTLNADQNASPGGDVVLLSPLATGTTLVIGSQLQELQPVDLQNQGGFYPAVINSALDRATIQIQQLSEKVDRSAKLPITSTAAADSLTADIVLLADHITEVDAVAGIVSDVTAVAGVAANVTTVAGISANVTTVAGVSANVTTVATVSANVTTVAGIAADVSAVANNNVNVLIVAGIAADVTTVAGIAADVTAVAANEANINAAVADLPALAAKVSKTGDTMTGPLVLPAGASGSQAIGADEAHTRADEVILNGGFSVAQETLGSRADDAYGHDGWIVLTQTGAIAPSTLADAENGMPTMARLTQSQAAAQRMGYLQVIEGQRCRHLRGQQVTFRFNRMRLSASANVRIAVLEWTGTEDAVTSDVVADWTSASYTAGGFFNATTLTVSGVTSQALTAATMADGASLTVTLGSTFNNLMVFAWVEAAAAQNVTLDLGKAQIDIGAAARPFRHYHRSRVLMDCSRHVVPLENKRPPGQAFSASAVTSISVYTPVPMMAVPSISVASHSFTNSAGTGVAGFTVSVTNVIGNVVRLDASGGSGLVAGNITLMVPAAGTFLKSQL